MKKRIYVGILIVSIFCTVIIALLFMKKEANVISVNTTFDKASYIDGEDILYSIEVINHLSQTVYYKTESAFAAIITGDNGFSAHILPSGNEWVYECEAGQAIAQDMSICNTYDYLMAMHIPQLDQAYLPEIGLNKKEGLQLPDGKYEIQSKFTYYLDKECKTTPQIALGLDTLVVTKDKTNSLEDACTLEDSMIFSVYSDKDSYQPGENIRTYAKIAWIEDKDWYSWYKEGEWLPLYFFAVNEETRECIESTIVNGVLPESYEKDIYYNPISYDFTLPNGKYLFQYILTYFDLQGREQRQVLEMKVQIGDGITDSSKTKARTVISIPEEQLIVTPAPLIESYDEVISSGGTLVDSQVGTASGLMFGVWHIIQKNGIEYYFLEQTEENLPSIIHQDAFNFSIVSDEYELACGIKVGMTTDEVLNMYPDMFIEKISPSYDMTFFNFGTYPNEYLVSNYDEIIIIDKDNGIADDFPEYLGLFVKDNKIVAITFYYPTAG